MSWPSLDQTGHTLVLDTAACAWHAQVRQVHVGQEPLPLQIQTPRPWVTVPVGARRPREPLPSRELQHGLDGRQIPRHTSRGLLQRASAPTTVLPLHDPRGQGQVVERGATQCLPLLLQPHRCEATQAAPEGTRRADMHVFRPVVAQQPPHELHIAGFREVQDQPWHPGAADDVHRGTCWKTGVLGTCCQISTAAPDLPKRPWTLHWGKGVGKGAPPRHGPRDIDVLNSYAPVRIGVAVEAPLQLLRQRAFRVLALALQRGTGAPSSSRWSRRRLVVVPLGVPVDPQTAQPSNKQKHGASVGVGANTPALHAVQLGKKQPQGI